MLKLHFYLSLVLLMTMPLIHADQRTPLTDGWLLQAATNVATAPKEKAWTEVPLASFAWKRALSKAKEPGSKLNVNEVHSLWYQRTIDIPAEWAGDRIVLDFHRIEGDAIIFCNDTRVGELLRPGGEMEITQTVSFGRENTLQVFVTRDYTDISRNFEEDILRYRTRGPKGRNLPMARWGMGITAPVELIRRPTPGAITTVFPRTSWREKTLAVDVDLQTTSVLTNTRLELTVTDAEGKPALTTSAQLQSVSSGTSTHTITAQWLNPIPWELDGPYLYTLSARLLQGSKSLDTMNDIRFGFREIWTEGRHVYLNGHISRWRIEWTSFGINANSIPFLKLLGRNVLYAQNNPTAWWCDWSETPYYSEELLNLLDDSGVGLLLPVPSVSNIRDLALKDEHARKDFQREMKLWIRRYRNHPCILAWCVSMNSFNSRDAIHPATLGQRSNYSHPQAKAIEDAIAIAKSFDPTRLGYGHADGNLADIATANTYPNFSPVQEVEDWPEMWASKGNMPYLAAEYALPYNGSFYNKTMFLGTEFAAMYFGNEAYAAEVDALLHDTVEISLGNKGHGNSLGQALPNFPMYWTLRSLYVTHSDRAWRTWGVLGWHYFNFGQGYGDPPGAKINRFSRYSVLKEPVTSRPDWANPNYDMHSVAMQPLLVYLAGTPTFTDKTHAYFAGETVRKQIAAVWDGPGNKQLQATWALINGDETVAAGSIPLALDAGDTQFLPIECIAPNVAARTELVLRLTVSGNGSVLMEDAFAIQIFPKPGPLAVNAKFAIWDPQGKTGAWLRELGIEAKSITPGDDLSGTDVLIIGREALAPGTRLPYSADDVRSGLRVVIMAQKPTMWEALGFLPDDLMTRRVFPCATDSPILEGLETCDLRDWRGSPDLLPAFKRTYGHDALRAPRSSNRGTVASVVLRLPDVVGFTPILNCEFDLDYSPLLQFRDGQGTITFCTLDLEERVGKAPAATQLAINLIKHLSDPCPPRPSAIVVAPDADPDSPALLDSVQKGGRAVILPRTAEELRAAGFSVNPTEIYRASAPSGSFFNAIGPRLLRWRDAITVDAFTPDGQPAGCTVESDGLFMIQRLGKGTRLFMQVSPDLLATRYSDDPNKQRAVRLSVFRLQQLTAQLLTNAGVAPDAAVTNRLCEVRAGPAFESLTTWHVLGPFYPNDTSPQAAVETAFPGENKAIAGDTNPNFTYKRDDGKALDFRGTVTANADGFIDLGSALKPDRAAVAYVTRDVKSDTDREAILRLGVDYFMQVWVNGETVYKLTTGHGSPKPNRHQVKVPLKQGRNVITLKIFAGSKGFGFWANLSKPGSLPPGGDRGSDEADAAPVTLYPEDIGFFDPYEYHYW